MCRPAIAATLALAALTIGGCKNQQQVQQEDIASLQAKFQQANDHYTAACYPPADNKAGVDAALGRADSSSPPPEQKPMSNSPACTQAKAEYESAYAKVAAAQAKAAAH
jgi:hypothetical protein